MILWSVAGAYVTSCSCSGQIHWPVDGTMNDSNGACKGVAAFWIQQGFHADTDLSGVAFALYNFFPPKISSGDWNRGLVVTNVVSDEQALAVERIVSGRAGGPFEAVASLVGEYLGFEHAEIVFSGGNTPSVWIDGRGGFRFEPTLDPDGSPVAAARAMFPFAKDFVVGRTSGEHYAFGEKWTPAYGEYGRFAFDNETMGVEHGFVR